MRSSRTIALGLGGLLGTLVVLLLVVPYLFRDRIAARLKTEIARSVNARVEWGGVSLGLIRDFPDVSLGLSRLSVVGQAPFAGDTLVAMQQARLVLDLGSVVGYLRRGERIVVREIRLDAPVVHLLVTANGTANWNITRPTTASGDTAKAIGVTLRDLTITDGRLTMADSQSQLHASVIGLSERLRGDFAADRMTLSTRTRADSVSLRFAGIPYLTRVGVELNADVNADLTTKKFTFTNDTLRLNQLLLAVSGGVQLGTPNTGVSITFATPSTAFRDILSLVPAIYAKDFATLQTSGTMSTSGSIRGAYGPHAFPRLDISARVDKGTFKYPTLPLAARDIGLDLHITNPGGTPDATTISVDRFHATIGGRPLDGRLVVRTPLSDPDVELRLLGELNLADVARTVELTSVGGLAGAIRADVAMHARRSDVDAKRYDRISAAGTFNASRVAFRTTAPARIVAIDTAALRFTPRTTELTAFAARAGASDARITGTLDNLLGYLLHDDALRGSASVTSSVVNLDEWRSETKTTAPIPVPPRVDATLHVAVGKATYGALTLANVRGDLRVNDQRVTLSDLRMETLGGTVVANGAYETTNLARPTFDMGLTLAKVDIPAAFAALTTVQQLAPIARWAQGAVAGTVTFSGPLAPDMTPQLAAITGKGTIETDKLVLQHAPVLGTLADAIKLEQLRSPTLGGVRLAFDVANGRVLVKPFVVTVAGIGMTVAGSSGIDQSILYNLALALPRSLLGSAGTAASAAIARLRSQAGTATGDSATMGAVVNLAGKLTGTVLKPALSLGVGDMARSMREAATNAVRQEVAARTAALMQTADSALSDAKKRARAEADKLIADAEGVAARMRGEARALADSATAQGGRRADSLAARATNPIARVAANAAATRAKSEAASQAERIVREADARADALVAEAKRQAAAIAP